MHIDIGTGIILEGSNHVIISGNSFSGMDAGAVEGSGKCRAIMVNSNVITDINRRADPPARAIDLGDAVKSNVEGNLID